MALAFDVTITYSEAVGDTFDNTDITLTNAQSLTSSDIITSTSGLVYTATISPAAGFSGVVTVQVQSGVAQNSSNQDNRASNVFSATVTLQSACVTGGAVPAGDEYVDLANDCETLLGLHDTLIGSATLSHPWSVHSNINSWYGIVVAERRVARLNLNTQGLNGSIPPALGDLSKLVNLNLGHNQLTGAIPTQLGNLSELTIIDLTTNQLTGAIPRELGSLMQLIKLVLSDNQLSGSIPTTLGDLSALEDLILSNNQFNAQIPTELTQLTSLKLLEIVNAQLTGAILDLSVMTSLEYVDLSTNQMTGTISSLANLTDLKRLHLKENQLSGTIPNIAVLLLLESFNVSNNQFAGQLPATVNQLSNLRTLSLTGNRLTGSVPDLSNMPLLEWVQLDRNQLTGTIPPLSNVPLLERYLVHRNKLSGPIPTMSNVPKLWQAYLHCNQFSGAIPASLNTATSLRQLLLFDNQLSGEIPDLRALSSLEWLWLNHNHLEGDFTTTASLLEKLPDISSLWVTLNGNLFAGVDRTSGALDSPPSGWTVGRRDPCSNRASFDAAAYSVNEGSDVTVTVNLALAAGESVTVPITVTHNGGASVSDYSGVPANLTFNSGDTAKSFTVTATDDSEDDDGESLTLRFGTLPDGVSAGSPALSMVSLQDDDLPAVTVSYEQESYTVGENSSVMVKVILSADPERSVTIPITKTNQDGASDADYSGVPSGLTFDSGDTEKSFTFAATQDTDNDDGESVKLAFGTLPTGVSAGTKNEATVNITDDDLPAVTVSYGAAAYTAIEGGSAVTVTVELGADPERTVTIPISVTHNGGASVSDYSGVPANLTFNSGDTAKSFTVTATDDSEDDDGESLTLRFGTLPDGVSAGSPALSIISLQDDDLPAVTVSYEQATYTVSENSSVTVKVTLSADPERTVTIPITKTNQGGASDADYSGVPSGLTFNSGDTEKTFSFAATQDTDDDDDESVKLAFGTLPTGVSAGTNSEATVNITDDDLPVVPTPTATSTPTLTPTPTATSTPTPTPTPTATSTSTPTPTYTPMTISVATSTPTLTPTPTATSTPTPTPTPTATSTSTPTPTYTPMTISVATSTPTLTPTPTATPTRHRPRHPRPTRPTPTPTATAAPPPARPTPTRRPPTKTPVPTIPASPTATPTSTATPTEPRPDPSPSVIPTSTSVPPTHPTSIPIPPRSAPCLVPHPATPVQVCRNNKTGSLRFYFVGPKEVFSGPLFPSISGFASIYPKGFLPAEVELYRGPSAGINKEITVHYLTNSNQLRVSTYYADNEYDTDKPYVFTIDIDGKVTHLAW